MASPHSIGPVESSRPGNAPGQDMNLREKALGAVEGLVQNFTPVKQIHQHVCGFHGYAHDMSRQVRAEHYCSHVNAELRQCVIYDTPNKDARLIGIEYIISRRLFETLPEEEKHLWHSHRHEVMSGALVAPEIPELAERPEMESLVDTYGKTFHTWQYDRGDTLPLGLPQLMMSFTQEGQLDLALIEKRDKECGIDSKAREQARREHIQPPEKLPEGCDMWESGKAVQTTCKEMPIKHPKA